MSESYVECMVARKSSSLFLFLKYLLWGLAIFAFLLSFVFAYPIIPFILAVVIGIGAYIVGLQCDIEYEYLYLDKEIVVDKVLHKQKRKRVATYEVEKIEIMAPLKSYHLDSYKNRQAKEVDISSGVEGMPEVRYVFYYNGEQKVIFEPNEALVKCVKNVAPRKVFMD